MHRGLPVNTFYYSLFEKVFVFLAVQENFFFHVSLSLSETNGLKINVIVVKMAFKCALFPFLVSRYLMSCHSPGIWLDYLKLTEPSTKAVV